MRVTPFDRSGPVLGNRLNANTVVRFDDVTSFDELMPALDDVRRGEPSAHILCTLDDVEQCAYTSMHACDDARIYFAGSDIDIDESDAEGQRRRNDAEVAHRAAVLDDPNLQVAWEALPGNRIGGRTDAAAILAIHREPDQVLDQVILVQRVPVDRDDLAIVAIPNGYFESDWDIFQNHAIVRRMARYGYRLFGIGSIMLGFDRTSPPSRVEAEAVVSDLVHLYGAPEAPEWKKLTQALLRQRILLIGYAENLEGLFEGQ